MDRRSLLSWLGVSAASGFSLSRVADAKPESGTRVVSLESFYVADADQMPRLHDYLGSTLLPMVKQIHGGPAICMDAIVAPQIPQVLVFAVFSSFDEMLDIRGRVAAHPRIRQARANLESERSVYQVQSQVLTAARESLRLPLDSDHLGILELRSFHAPGWHDAPPQHFSELLSRAGIHPIVNGSTAAGEHLPRFTYLLPFDSLAAREDAWARLDAETEWIEIQGKSSVKVTGKSIYKLAPYSRWA
jgi:hypothetical protein